MFWKNDWKIKLNSRKSLTIRGIPEKEGGESWDETRKVVCEKLAEYTGDDPRTMSQNIERIHRGSGRPDRKGHRVVHALFFDWNDSEHLKREFFKHGKGSNIFIDQRYGPNTSFRRNKALERRKELKGNGTIQSGYVAYPAKLLVKYKTTDKKYTLHEDFSNLPIPVEELRR